MLGLKNNRVCKWVSRVADVISSKIQSKASFGSKIAISRNALSQEPLMLISYKGLSSKVFQNTVFRGECYQFSNFLAKTDNKSCDSS